jgi:large subunit ribosomal protein L9
MEVILREDVPNLGTTGDIVKVKPGFARNYLLPRGMAVVADRRSRAELDHQKRVADEKRERDQRHATVLAERVSSQRLLIQARAGEEGKLFGSVTNIDVERALADRGFTIDRRRIRLEDPIKAVGEYVVPVQLMVGVTANVTVVVEPEGGAAAATVTPVDSPD